MELTNNENPFDPTPKLKSSPVPICFIPFNYNKDKCSYCGIHISTNNNQCSEHKTSRNSDFYTQNIQEWCEYCSEISYFKQIVPFLSCEQSKVKKVIDLNLIDCKLCGELIYQEITNFFMFRLCSNCYLISSGWTESTLVKEPISILYLPWWDNYDQCMGCSSYCFLKFISDCQKWCSYCFVIYTGCRYCLTTIITFGITDQSRCLKCKRKFFISINITPFISGNNDIDELLASTKIFHHKIADYMNNFDKNSNPLNVYNYITVGYKTSSYFDSKLLMKWIQYSEITNLKKIAEGGFGIIYKATWSNRTDPIAIKRFSNSQDISKYFLNELKSLYQCYKLDRIIKCYGITKDPETGEYMMIMDYATGGNLHNYLQKGFANIIWKKKLHNLWKISDGLHTIHKKNFIHRDFHSGNVLYETREFSSGNWQIGDLGLSQPANITSLNNEIYGVIPYIAPEVFNGAAISKESDIYSTGMIMWEFTTGCKPFANVDHDTDLIYKIIDGKRPEMTNDTPECFANLMKRCWDSNPKKRPSAKEICETFYDWTFIERDVEQFNQAEKKRLELIELKQLGPEFAERSHPGAIYTSRALSSLISNSSSINSFSTNSFNIKNIKKDNKLEIKESNDKEYNSKEYELDINDDIQSSSVQNINSTIQNTQQYNSKEYELDINDDIQSSSLQNINSNIQNTQHQNPSRPLIHSTVNVSRKRKFDELETGKAQDNGKPAHSAFAIAVCTSILNPESDRIQLSEESM